MKSPKHISSCWGAPLHTCGGGGQERTVSEQHTAGLKRDGRKKEGARAPKKSKKGQQKILRKQQRFLPSLKTHPTWEQQIGVLLSEGV